MRIRHLVLSILVSGSLASFPLSAAVWTVPGAVNAGGLNNTRFVSDLTITNPGTAAAQVTISFLPSSTAPKNVTLGSGETVVYRNVVNALFGLSGAGALSISSLQPLLLRARTYNTASGGTYGVALPVYEDDRLLTPGETGDSLWISQDASGSSGYRTNIAVVFPDADGGEAIVTVYDADGKAAGEKTFSLSTAGFQQFSVGSFAGAVPVGRAQIVVTSGRAAAYAVVVDNVTGDSSLFAFEDLPGGIQDVLVNGVARANGRNGAFFRTDGRFYNTTDTDATVTVAFHASGNTNASPQSASFNLPAGKIRDVVDVLETLMGLPFGSAGALRFKSTWPVAILCRTSNVDPSGTKPGTFGSQQKAVPLLSFLNSADAGALVAGIRQNPSFRTNVGFAAGADGAAWALTLKTAGGATVATASGSLGAFGWTQPNVQDLFPTVTVPEDATLLVKVTSGSVDVYDSSIDNTSGDSVVTPAAVSPVAIPASATIGPQGGSIRSDDGRLTLRIPAGTLLSSVAVSLETGASNEAPQGSGSSYRLSPGGLVFARPATLSFRYRTDDVTGSVPGSLGLAFRSGGSWFVVTGGSVDSASRKLIVPITSASPAPAALNRSVRPLVDPVTEWAPFVCRKLYAPQDMVPISGKVPLAVRVTGQSSSEGGPGYEVLGAPVNPQSLDYAWYVNGVLLGSGRHGTVNDLGPTAEYTAPPCLPPLNPVRVEVKIINPAVNGQSLRFASTIRVLPRDWIVTFTWGVDFICTGGGTPIADHLKYTRDLSFSLADDLGIVDQDNLRTPGREHGTPALCPNSGFTRVERGSDGDLKLLLTDRTLGHYHAHTDQFDLAFDFILPTSGYKVTAIVIGVERTTELPKLERTFKGVRATLKEGHQTRIIGDDVIPFPFATGQLLAGLAPNPSAAVCH